MQFEAIVPRIFLFLTTRLRYKVLPPCFCVSVEMQSYIFVYFISTEFLYKTNFVAYLTFYYRKTIKRFCYLENILFFVVCNLEFVLHLTYDSDIKHLTNKITRK